MKNYYYLAAGIITLLIALLHLFGGQISLVDPLLSTDLIPQVKAELLGAWHLVTIILFLFGIILFREGLNVNAKNHSLVKVISLINFLFAICFIIVSLVRQQHAPQYILFLPVALILYLGYQKIEKSKT